MESIATRYSAAVVSIAKQEAKLEQYKFAVLSMSNLFANNPKLFKFLKSYSVKDEEKEKVIDEITKEFGLKNFTNFIKLLAKKHCIFDFKNIEKEIIKNINFELNVAEGIIYSTEPLSEAKINEISEVISKKLGNKVELVNKVDTRLIAGVKVVVHDHIFDGSVKYKLETMKEQLKERRNG